MIPDLTTRSGSILKGGRTGDGSPLWCDLVLQRRSDEHRERCSRLDACWLLTRCSVVKEPGSQHRRACVSAEGLTL